jgi:DNA-directed RNA polymerase subunit beta
MKMVKVFIAVKRKLQPGDKMAGPPRQQGRDLQGGPEEDMPFLADGTPVDLVLNPLGVPSRMNVGQILETHMGWAARGLGRSIDLGLQEYRRSGDMTPVKEAMKLAYGEGVYNEVLSEMDEESFLEAAGNVTAGVPIATPVFDGAKEADVNDALERAGFDTSGQSWLFDGRTGERFQRKVTVGVKYLLKLHHLVDDKIHARSTGPLLPRHPAAAGRQGAVRRPALRRDGGLGSRGLRGGLHAPGDAHRQVGRRGGRTKVYESIVKGEDNFEAGVPESFNVLVKEVRGLGLNMELMDAEEE